MSSTLPGADVRGFYAALGIELPGWAQQEASIGCFANPDAHARGDRDPSCSVNVETGAWRCWGCGAKGGAFDAALARGLDSRQAFELKVAYGLAERDPERPARSGAPAPRAGRAVNPSTGLRRPAGSRRWSWTSSSSPRRTPGWRRLHVAAAGAARSSSGVCGRARRCSSSGAAGSADECSSRSATGRAGCAACCATRRRTTGRRRCSRCAAPGWG